MKKSKKNAEKPGQETPLNEDERFVCIRLIGTADAEKIERLQELLFVGNVMGKELVINAVDLRNTLAEGGTFSFPILSERLTVTLNTLRQMFDCTKQHHVALCKTDGDHMSNAVSPDHAKKKGAPVKTEKQPKVVTNINDASGVRNEIARSYINFLDIFDSVSHVYKLHTLDGFDCSIEVEIQGGLLVSPASRNTLRPFLITVHNIENLPTRKSGNDAPSLITLRIRYFGEEIRLKFLMRDRLTNPRRAVIFLGDKSLLESYVEIFSDPMRVEIFTSGSSALSAVADKSDKAPQISQPLLGEGCFSLQDYLTDKQTYFDQDVQLLSSRSSTSEGNYLETVVKLTADFFVPFPPVEHVNSVGDPVREAFLARAIIILPFSGEWVESVLSRLIKTLTSHPVSKGDVHLYEPPEEEPEDFEEANSKNVKKKKGNVIEEPVPPKKVSPFEQPFKVVTPPGISGFEVMDSEWRTFCLEGPLSTLHKIICSISSSSNNHPDLTLLLNSEVFLPRRLYQKFPPLVVPPRPFCPPEPDSSDGSESEDGAPFEAEAGGTGGRIHRIKLCEPLSILSKKQEFLLRRSLSESCLHCINKLMELRCCHSLREVVARDLFPSASEVISLERSFGQNLDLTDLFAKNEFVNVEEVQSFSAVSTQALLENHVDQTIYLDNLLPSQIGCLVSFDGTLLQSDAKKIPPKAIERFKKCFWMQSLDGAVVLCAFPKNTPGSTIRYHVEGQVVRCGDDLLLYVLCFDTLAKGFTNSRNVAYERFLRQRKQEVENHAMSVALSASNRKSGVKPIAAPSAVAPQVYRPTKGSLDSSDEDDAQNPPQVTTSNNTKNDDKSSTAVLPHAARSTMNEAKMTNSSKKVYDHRSTKSVEEKKKEYEKMWELYEKASEKKSISSDENKKLRSMHF